MQGHSRSLCAHLVFVAALGACESEPAFFEGVEVYVGGVGTSTPVVWHNGKAQSTGCSAGMVMGLRVFENAVVTVGSCNDHGYFESDRAKMAINGHTRAIDLDGGLAYVAGGTNSPARAAYWIVDLATTTDNTLGVLLFEGAPVVLDGDFGLADDIVAEGGQVFVGGVTRSPSTGRNVATVWRDEVPTQLTDGTEPGQVRAIAVLGDVLFAAGSVGEPDQERACYWRNAEQILLESDPISRAHDIAVDGDDVYVVGQCGKQACDWKNGVRAELLSQHDASETHASEIEVVDGIVWVAGDELHATYSEYINHNHACLWKDGEQYLLDAEPETSAFGVRDLQVLRR